MVDSVRLSTEITLEYEDFDWNIWRIHIYENDTMNYFVRQGKVRLSYYPVSKHLIIDGKLLTLLYDTDVLNVDDCYGVNLEGFLTDVNDCLNMLFTRSVLDIRFFKVTRIDYCFNVKTPYVSMYIDLLNCAFRMTNNGSKINHVLEKQLSGSVYIKTKSEYVHNERKNYVLNYYDKSDWLGKERLSKRRTHPVDVDLAQDVFRMEVQCGYRFVKQICETHGISNCFEQLLSYEIALWAEETIYNRIFKEGSSELDFFTYKEAKKKLNSESARKALIASAQGKRITSDEFAYGRKIIRNAGIFPFCFLPRDSKVTSLPGPLKLLREKCKQTRHLED